MKRVAHVNRHLGSGVPQVAATSHPAAFFDDSQISRRQAPLVPEAAALLVIDMQNFNLDRGRGAEGRKLTGPEYQYYWQRAEEVTPRIQRLLAACRRVGIEVIYTVIEALTADGRDRSIDYKISGFCVPKGSWDGQVLPAIGKAESQHAVALSPFVTGWLAAFVAGSADG